MTSTHYGRFRQRFIIYLMEQELKVCWKPCSMLPLSLKTLTPQYWYALSRRLMTSMQSYSREQLGPLVTNRGIGSGLSR